MRGGARRAPTDGSRFRRAENGRTGPHIGSVNRMGTHLLIDALAFAAYKHRLQRRKDPEASPYINHPIALAHVLAGAGITNAKILAAAVLHDTIEDTETTYEE